MLLPEFYRKVRNGQVDWILDKKSGLVVPAIPEIWTIEKDVETQRLFQKN